MNTVISAENLTVGYDKNGVITGIDIKALKGQIICLLGPNGAGKSTILRTLSGLLAPVSGTVSIDGTDINKIKKKNIAKKMSLVLTEKPIPSLITVYEMISMGRTPYTDFLGRLSDSDRSVIDESLKITGIEHLSNRYFSQLSDGEKQKVMIARALVQEPELIVLDEPTSHLDIKHKIEVIKVLRKLSNEKNITCILSLHDIDLALKGCQTVLLVNEGRVVAQGSPEEIVHNGIINSLYDIKSAKYNELLGSVEMKGADANDVFVISGNSTGIRIYRSLSRMGIGITSGVLHRNDTDYEVADGICSMVVAEKPFECIGEEALAKAKELVLKAKSVVDSGFPVGTCNLGNAELLQFALDNNKSVFSMRTEREYKTTFGDDNAKVIYVNGTDELARRIRENTL